MVTLYQNIRFEASSRSFAIVGKPTMRSPLTIEFKNVAPLTTRMIVTDWRAERLGIVSGLRSDASPSTIACISRGSVKISVAILDKRDMV